MKFSQTISEIMIDCFN